MSKQAATPAAPTPALSCAHVAQTHRGDVAQYELDPMRAGQITQWCRRCGALRIGQRSSGRAVFQPWRFPESAPR